MNNKIIIEIIVVFCWNIFCIAFYLKEQKKNNQEVNSLHAKIYFSIMIIANIVLAFVLSSVYTENSILFSLKRLGLVAILWIIAPIDKKEHRIPNIFLVALLGYRAVLLLAEIIWERERIIETLLSEGLAMLIILFLAAVCILVIRNSIGAGDIKLMLLMAACQGTIGVGASLFTSMLVSFFAALFLLAAKKKTRKDVIPLGPCIWVGTYLSVFLIGA